jgi:hypothetical protein
MATAFVPFVHLFEALQGLLAWFAPRSAPAPSRPPRSVAPAQGVLRQPAKPLRVLRVVEPCAPRSIAGRMVISGRMADVCAELDRLAAQEARGC